MSTLFIFYLGKFGVILVGYRVQIRGLLHHSIEPRENVQARGEKQPQKRQKVQGVYQ
jgi:hypothetical protein